MIARIPSNETQRLAALREYHILDTAPEAAYDDITTLAAHICDVPISMISLVDESRQWFKSKTGLRQNQTDRDVAFCAHAILKPEPLVIRDATKDRRFTDNVLVTRLPRIRFYAGFPLVAPRGLMLGTLCAIDRKPRQLTAQQFQTMQALSRQVMALLESRRVSAHLAEALEHVKVLQGLLPICAWCKRIRDDKGYWTKVETYLEDRTEADFTHGICPECLEKAKPKTRTKSDPGGDVSAGSKPERFT